VEFIEFTRHADGLINRLTPRIDYRQGAFVRRAAEAGEWYEAIDNLIATLIKDRIGVTPAENSELLCLLSFMEWPGSRLDGLVGDAVEEPG
jgi:hypothetical protein